MKKIRNKITSFLLIILTLMGTFLPFDVKAYTTQDVLYQDDNYQWWVAIYNRANTHMVASPESMIRRSSDNRAVYCIQPQIQFYNGSGVNGTIDSNAMVSMTGFSTEQMERIKLIAYYGYGYGNHTSPEWYYATQLLIWANTAPGYVYAIADEDYSLTPSSRYDGYYNEINYLVDNHATAPSFVRQTFEIKNGDTITIEDTNHVLSKFYEETETDDYKTTIDGNNLIVTAKRGYTGVINLNVKSNDNPPMLYEGANQLCMSAGDPVMMMAKLNIIIKTHVTGYKTYGDKDAGAYRPEKDAEFELYNNSTNELITTLTTNENGYIEYDLEVGEYRIHQTKGKKGYKLVDDYILNIDGSNSNETIYFQNNLIKGKLEFTKTDFSESKTLPNTLVEIYNADTNELVFSEKTDENGKISIDNIKYGKYYILEKEAPEGYQLNPEKMYFEIKEDGQVIKSKMKDEIITGTLEFTKTDFSTDEALPNTLIEIYKSDNNELVFSGRTDEDGKITIKKLEYGNYYILEKEAPERYTLNPEKMFFEIRHQGKVVKANMKDKLITGKLEFTKTDFSESKTLPNTLIEIYNADTDELVFSERTNENGQIIIEELEYGNYYILEKEAPEGYQLNPEKMYFEIKEDGQIVKANMKDEQIIEVPDTEKDKSYYFIVYGFSLMLVGSLVILYAKNKKKRK